MHAGTLLVGGLSAKTRIAFPEIQVPTLLFARDAKKPINHISRGAEAQVFST